LLQHLFEPSRETLVDRIQITCVAREHTNELVVRAHEVERLERLDVSRPLVRTTKATPSPLGRSSVSSMLA
jgi:hypothetical protein